MPASQRDVVYSFKTYDCELSIFAITTLLFVRKRTVLSMQLHTVHRTNTLHKPPLVILQHHVVLLLTQVACGSDKLTLIVYERPSR